MDNEKVKAETARYKKIPQINDFTDENGTDHMKQVVQENYERIKAAYDFEYQYSWIYQRQYL